MKKQYKLVWIDATLSDPREVFKNFIITSERDEDNWIEVEAWIDFESTPADLKKNVRKTLDNAGRNIDVFSVFDDKKLVITEEDL